MHYPTDYGFIPDTCAPDGDPLDVLIIVYEPTFPGCLVEILPIGVLVMRDEKGVDEKILAVPVNKLTPMYDNILDIENFPEIQLERVKHFFTHYKDLEPGKWAKIDRIGNLADARKVILDSIALAAQQK